MIPLLVGVAFLFYDGKSVVGWLLTIVGAAIILAGVLMNMDIYFKPTTLYNTLMMLGLFFGGLGVIARSLRYAVNSPSAPQARRGILPSWRCARRRTGT